ncbi:MAG TPA: hypothetical protein DCX14_10615 [Flavobacteriales bacterium]|jgi:hypothetical protein|nr:hypothetical protein [Flavobacteriales bacterium]HAW20624.1 hypothetical protein [Flavobacteriales bacterium]
MNLLRTATTLFIVAAYFTSFSQESGALEGIQIHGNFDLYAQQYNEDSIIGANAVPEKSGINAFTNLIISKGKFSAGIRVESYLPPVQGFDNRYGNQSVGVPFRYASFSQEGLEITAGNFYEQYGSGLLLRSYEARGLGLDNAFDGLRVRYSPYKGLYLKGLVGNQRYYWDKGDGTVRALDGEVQFNELISKLETSKFRLSIGGSFVSKYQAQPTGASLELPENVAGWSGRAQLNYEGISLLAEYARKMNDPNKSNHYIYRPGQGLFASATYSQKGFGINLSAKTIDNMEFRSDREAGFNDLFINYLPALTRQHTYNLAATLYPYATQPNGEIGFQSDISYKIKKGSKVGGKYGTTIMLNASWINSLKRSYISDANGDTATALLEDFVYLNEDPGREGYTTSLFKASNEVLYRDVNIEVARKFNKAFKLKLSYIYLDYNIFVIQNKVSPNVITHIAVVEGLNKLSKKHSIRWEFQHMLTEQDQGDWIFGLVEYAYSPHWIVSVLNQYNYGNKNKDLRVNYPTAQVVYVYNANRISLGYGRQRAGIFCIGGVCRNVPAANAVTLAITSSF